jgi:hypothetical protein
MSERPITSERIEELFPICAELRSKKSFLLGRAPRTSAEVLDASNDCWCALTDDRLGVDKDPVHPDDCRRGRRCFRSLLEGSAVEGSSRDSSAGEGSSASPSPA